MSVVIDRIKEKHAEAMAKMRGYLRAPRYRVEDMLDSIEAAQAAFAEILDCRMCILEVATEIVEKERADR